MKRLLRDVAINARYGFRSPYIPPVTYPSRQRLQGDCFQCRYRAERAKPSTGTKVAILGWHSSRSFSCTPWRQKNAVVEHIEEASHESNAEAKSRSTSSTPSASSSTGIKPATQEQLPSRQEQIRWRVSQRFNKLMDDLMPRLALATQRINTYTGTDYSGIEALRKEIAEQEKLVRQHHDALQAAKRALEDSRARESASRKEVVTLLERRHSWSDSDLERYMSLIRSEHVNEQAVAQAKEGVGASERELDGARAQLEKMERTQYHEEQIWSDTIRRNGTWVTMGLMGVNILLLLVTMGVVEPWRRRRMVGEIKRALEDSRIAGAAAVEVGNVREGREVLMAVGEGSAGPAGAAAAVSGTVMGEQMSTGDSAPNADAALVALQAASNPPFGLNNSSSGTVEMMKLEALDLFSRRTVTMAKLEITAIALEGALVGATLAGMLFMLLRPR